LVLVVEIAGCVCASFFFFRAVLILRRARYYSPVKKNIMGRWCVLKGMQLVMWESDKAWQKGKKPTEEVKLNYQTQTQPLGKKMGKAFCIHILTNGCNEAFWAKDTEDQNAWIEAIRAACKKPEAPPVVLMPQQASQSSHSDIQIQLALPAAGPAGGMDPNIAYQNAMLQQQYQQQMAAYQQQLQQPMYPPLQQQNYEMQQFSSSAGQLPMVAPQAYGAGYQPQPPMTTPLLAPSVPDNYYTHASPPVSPMPSPGLQRHSPPASAPQVPLSSVPSSTRESPYGRF
jgi:hypothetical protein